MIFTVGWLIFKPSEVFYKSFPRITSSSCVIFKYETFTWPNSELLESLITISLRRLCVFALATWEVFSTLTNPVQRVSLFCSGEEKDEHAWSCRALTFRGDSEKSALAHRKKPAEEVQTSGQSGSWTPARWGLWVGVQLGGLGEEVLGVFGGLPVQTWKNGRIWMDEP